MVRWHRKGFRLPWRTLSRRGPGRLRIPQEVRELIHRLAFENGWGARKIQGELSKLGFIISLATVSRNLPKRSPDPGRRQRRMTFLQDHKDAIAAMDFCVVPTVSFQVLYVDVERTSGRFLTTDTQPHRNKFSGRTAAKEGKRRESEAPSTGSCT